MVTIEQILDEVANQLIVNIAVNPDIVRRNQKTIRRGVINRGRLN